MVSGIPWNATHIRALWKRLAGEPLGKAEGRSLRGGRGPKVPETKEEREEAFELLWKHLVLLEHETGLPLLEAMVQVCAGQMGPWRWRRLEPVLQIILSDAPRLRFGAEPGSKGRGWAWTVLATHRVLQEELRQEGVARTVLLDRLEREPMGVPRNVAGRHIQRLVGEGTLALDGARDVLRRVPGPEGEGFPPLEVGEIIWISDAD